MKRNYLKIAAPKNISIKKGTSSMRSNSLKKSMSGRSSVNWLYTTIKRPSA